MTERPETLFRIFIGGPISNAILITADFDDSYCRLYQRSHNSEYIRSDLFCIGEKPMVVAIYAFVDPIGSIRQFIYNEAKDLRSYILTHGDCHVGLNAFLRIREPLEICSADLNRLSEDFHVMTGKMHIRSKLQRRLAAKSSAFAG